MPCDLRQTPSKIVHLKNLPREFTDEELVRLGQRFGRVVHTVSESKVGVDIKQAFIEFAKTNGAVAMISHFLSSSEPAMIEGKPVDLQYSHSQEWDEKVTDDDRKVLLITIEGDGASYVTINHLRLMFSPYGFVYKITKFEYNKTRGYEALVHYDNPKSASAAKDNMEGADVPLCLMPDGTSQCWLKVAYPQVKHNLKIKQRRIVKAE